MESVMTGMNGKAIAMNGGAAVMGGKSIAMNGGTAVMNGKAIAMDGGAAVIGVGSPAMKRAAANKAMASETTRDLLALLLKIGVAAGIAALVFTFVYGIHRNTDPDMNPAIKDGDLAAFYRLDKDYVAGDLLALSFRGERQIRRVVAVAGDTVDITEDGLIVNGAMQQEPEIYEKTERYADGTPLPVTLAEGQVFVLGDSRENATDSRVYGPVNTDDTLGSVIALFRRRAL
jgi:signal peptidase I